MSVIKECRKALKGVNESEILWAVHGLKEARRVFCVGNGGGAAHAMHFAADLRKIAYKQAYSFDNVAEMTARINDNGWETAWSDWMDCHGFSQLEGDRIFLFSVGGAQDGLSKNLSMGSFGIVGANGAGRWMRIVIPSTSTPVVEGCQAVIAHDIVDRLAR